MSNRRKTANRVVTGKHARRPIEPTTLQWSKTGVPGMTLMMDPSTTGWRATVDDGNLHLLVSRNQAVGWHLSVTHTGQRYPTWDELADARERFVPDEVTMAMVLPPKDEYVNVHERCLHLFEIRGEDVP